MSTPISRKGLNRLLEELDRLKRDRPLISKIIQEAREEGDLSENAAYDAARERQGLQEARISYIESRLSRLEVVDFSRLRGDKVIYGAKVRLHDQDTEEEKEYTLLGPDEFDLVKGGISVESPVAVSLLGKEVGDEISVEAPRGRICYEIIDLAFPGEAMFRADEDEGG
jgi:transcription elongation factor GreA